MSDPEHARMMLAAARRDTDALVAMGTDPAFSDEVFGFHAQQATEKSLKACLSQLGLEYPRTHDLSLLMGMIEDTGHDLPDDARSLVDLTDFAVQFRYEAYESVGAELDRSTTIGQINKPGCLGRRPYRRGGECVTAGITCPRGWKATMRTEHRKQLP
jgi:hypothetical protein